MKIRELALGCPAIAWFVLSASLSGWTAVRAEEAPDHRLPTIYLIGDSTVRNGTKGQQGWGDPFLSLCDPAKVRVENRARGGRSSRTYLTEGLWDRVRDALRPGDIVLMQFGHNDGGPLVGGRARASLKGNGEESREVVDPKTGKHEVVHTYGWYLRRYIAETKARGATPVVCSLVPRNIWDSHGKIRRASGDYGRWAAEAAKQGGALFIDLNERVAERYEADGAEVVKTRYFGTDHTHTTDAGARVTAGIVAKALQGLNLPTLRGALRSASGETNATPRPNSTSFRFDFDPGPAAPGGVGATTTYLADLKSYVEGARSRGEQPILVTPMHRRRFDAQGKVVNSLGDDPEAVRQAAREEGVPLIDLNVMSRALDEALGPEGSSSAFVDGTHHHSSVSDELARCVVEVIREKALPPARYLVEGLSPFDPSRPGRPEAVRLGGVSTLSIVPVLCRSHLVSSISDQESSPCPFIVADLR